MNQLAKGFLKPSFLQLLWEALNILQAEKQVKLNATQRDPKHFASREETHKKRMQMRFFFGDYRWPCCRRRFRPCSCWSWTWSSRMWRWAWRPSTSPPRPVPPARTGDRSSQPEYQLPGSARRWWALCWKPGGGKITTHYRVIIVGIKFFYFLKNNNNNKHVWRNDPCWKKGKKDLFFIISK